MLTVHHPDVVVVASPTVTHADVCRDLVEQRAASTILVEKPIATALSDLNGLLDLASHAGVLLRGIYHAAYAPEVAWARTAIGASTASIARFEATFCDPYGSLDGSKRESYGDSWLDSGINALSVLSRFVDVQGVGVRAMPELTSTYEGIVQAVSSGRAIRGRIFTSWHCLAAAKVSRFEFPDGRVMTLNHQATTGQIVLSDKTIAAFGPDLNSVRLTNHYAAAFREMLIDERLEPELDDRKLLDLLLGAYRPDP